MSETASSPEPATGPIETAPTTVPAVVQERDVEPRRRGGRLNVVLAWVGIVAGTVFVVAVIFFSGFALGASVGGGHHHGGHHGHGNGQMEHDGGGPRHGWQGGPGFQGGPGGGGFGQGPGQGPGSPPPTPPGR